MASSGGEVLFRRWMGRVADRRNFLKIYGLGIFGLANLILLYMYHSGLSGSVGYDPAVFQYWFTGNFILIFIVRIQLAALTGMMIIRDFSGSLWELIRTTSVSHDEIIYAVARYFFIVAVIPIAVVMFLHCGVMSLVTIPGADGMFSVGAGALVMIGVIGYGVVLSGLSFMGGIIMGKPIGAVIGALFPVILLIVAGGLIYLLGRTGVSITDVFWGTLVDILMMVSNPEGYFNQLTAYSVSIAPSGQEYTAVALAVIMGVIGLMVWLTAGVVVLRKRG